MNPDFQEQLKKVNNFNENDSKKMIEIKKICSSKLTLWTLIFSLLVIAFYFTLNLVNQLLYFETINFTVVLSLVGDSLLNCIFPAIFIFFLISIYRRSKSDVASNGRDGLLNKILSLRSYTKFFYIINIIGFACNAFMYLNLESLVTQYPDMFLDVTEFELNTSFQLGLYFLILTGIYTCTWYSLSKGSKNGLKSIIFDSSDHKYIDLLIYAGFLILSPLLETIGTSLALFGINNPLTSIYYTEPILVTDILYLIYNILSVGLTILIGILFIKIRKILMEVKGSNNPLNDDNVVYTINLDKDDN